MTEKEISIEILNRLNISYPSNKDRFNIHCFVHDDRHPSMTITLSINGTGPGYCKCWSCGYGKTLKQVYWEMKERSIYKDLHINSNQSLPIIKTFKDLSKIPKVDFIFEGKTTPLQNVDIGKEWIIKRGLTEKVIKKYNIQYVSFGITKSKCNPDDKSCWTYFNDRAIIPIYEKDENTNLHILISLEGRDLRGEDYFYKKCKEKNMENIMKRKSKEMTNKMTVFPVRRVIKEKPEQENVPAVKQEEEASENASTLVSSNANHEIKSEKVNPDIFDLKWNEIKNYDIPTASKWNKMDLLEFELSRFCESLTGKNKWDLSREEEKKQEICFLELWKKNYRRILKVVTLVPLKMIMYCLTQLGK